MAGVGTNIATRVYGQFPQAALSAKTGNISVLSGKHISRPLNKNSARRYFYQMDLPIPERTDVLQEKE